MKDCHFKVGEIKMVGREPQNKPYLFIYLCGYCADVSNKKTLVKLAKDILRAFQ